MNEKLFRIQVLDQAVGVGSTDAGVILEVSLPRDNRFRYVWCYYDNRSFAAVGDEAWIQFSNNGEVALEYPAAIIPLANTRLGLANYPFRINPDLSIGNPQANTTAAQNVGGAGVIWWNNLANNTAEAAIHPFRVVVIADTVRLLSNKAGNTRALLAVFSASDSP